MRCVFTGKPVFVESLSNKLAPGKGGRAQIPLAQGDEDINLLDAARDRAGVLGPDRIFTDPAPLEALVQRFGRVNRRRLQPDPAPVHVFAQPDTGQRVYDDALVQATLAILARENDKPVQKDRIGVWLDEIYSDAIQRKWLAQYDHAATEFAETLIRELRPFDSDDGKETLFYDAFDGVDVLPLRFLDEYRALAESEPLRAQELLVSIRSG